ncbi:hypothetical protein K488DRAFT_79933 [Vararia minispora EC-137]|uniref:Uncharacterized protein n=1 Tax=Vararia minispora EC-137 TaxID=1314806 RepID=A0ACB8QDU7_9AGAM|nr:hypothetical protein K488DRAFT_79933 [Vararia minispora EC-137]
MKFFAIFAALAASALAQTVNIGSPKDGSTIAPGPLNVTIDRPDTLTGSTEVAVVISIVPCSNGPCPDPAERLGSTLYQGSYDPQFPPIRTPDTQPQQNFTVTVPSSLAGQRALLSVVHLSLVGAGPFPLFEIKNVTVNVSG